MKLVIAIIKPERLDAVRQALTSLGVQGVTVSEVRGFGRQKGHKEIYRGTEYAVDFVPKLKLEIVAPADLATSIVNAVCAEARTGAIGDGKLFVLDVEQAVRVRTGETGPEAL